MKKNIFFLLILLFSIFISQNSYANFVEDELIEYQFWLENLKKEYVTKGIRQETVDKIFYDFPFPNKIVFDFDKKQPEFALTTTDYINKLINEQRVIDSRKKYKENKELLDDIYNEFGVNPEYIIAFWAVETNFGSHFGGFNVLHSLISLSYNNRRADFFKKELYNALLIIDKYNIDYHSMRGSWAGAMGHFQFMPSTFNAYAIDFDNDYKIDIWKSKSDAMASAANYLSSIGWKKDEKWGMEVSLPWNFDFSQSDLSKKQTIAYWNKIGVRNAKGKKIKLSKKLKAAIIVPEGRKGAAYLVLNNFYKIKSWNNSENYALAIGILSDYIKTNKKWKEIIPHPATRVKSKDILKIQTLLNKIGLYNLKEDGKLGKKTKSAIKEIQAKVMLPQDGFPDHRFIQKIEHYNPKYGFYVPVPKKRYHKAPPKPLRKPKIKLN
jgi:membrane-bound lytic murein transglycosylase B